MYGEKGSTHKKTLHHWIVLQISHLVAILYGATLQGRMLAEVTDVLNVFSVQACLRSAAYNREGMVSFISCLSLHFPTVFYVSLCLLEFLNLSICLHVYLLRLSHTRSKKTAGVCSQCPEGSFVALYHLSEYQLLSQPPRARNEKMETVFCLGCILWLNEKLQERYKERL